MTQYQIKEGVPYINIDGKLYRVKDEFVDYLESEVSAFWSKEKFDKNHGQDLSTWEFENDSKAGITLPLSIAERIEIGIFLKARTRGSVHDYEFVPENSPQSLDFEYKQFTYAILKPLAVKEQPNEAVEFAEWIDKENYERLMNGQWRIKGMDWLASVDKTTHQLFEIFKNRNK